MKAVTLPALRSPSTEARHCSQLAAAPVGAASLRRVARDRKTLSGRRGRRAIGGLPVCKYFSRCRVLTKLYHPSRGTEGSNPASSSRQSVSRPHPLSKVENPGFPRGCPRLAWRPGRQRRAGCFDIAPTGGNISAGPYSSTAVPLMGLARMPRRSQRTRGSGLNVK
jgi:hypothetical protein